MDEWISGAGGGGGGKGGGGGGSVTTPTEQGDTLASVAYAKFVDLLGEGEIEGLKDGLKSIYFDKTPLQAGNGSYNFQNVTIATRNGTQSQDHIPGFSDSEAETGVDVQLQYGQSVVRTLTNANATAVRVTVNVPALQEFRDNGDIVGSAVVFNVEVQYNGGGYTLVGSHPIRGKTSSSYSLSRRYAISGPFPVDIRVTRVTPDPTSTKVQNLIRWVSYTEIVEAKLRYPNSALVAGRISAKQFGSIPQRSYRVRGLKVQIPSNGTVDPTTGRVTYSGIWDGSFQAARWCSDPAWCLWDLLTSKRYGFGDYISASQLDKFSFYAISQYCSELVPDGFGGQEPRFSLNICINSAQEAYQLISSLVSVFRGMAYWAAGSVALTQDRPADPSFIFNTANVVDGLFTYSGSSLKTRATVAVVEYLDLTTQDTAYEYVEDQAAIARYGLNVKTVQAIGCTSRGQAARVGRWLLYTEGRETETVSFSVGPDAGVSVRPGHVIAITDPTRAGSRQGGRIVSATTTRVRIDQDISVGPDANLSVILPDNSFEIRKIGLLAGRDVYVQTAFSQAPQSNAVWVIGDETLRTQLFRVLSVAEQQDGTYQVSALAHDPSKYGYVEDDLQLQPRDITRLTDPPGAPTGLTLQESLYGERGAVKVLVSLSWVPPSGAVYYEVLYRVDNGNFESVGYAPTQPNVELRDARSGLYEFQVSAISILGKRSAPATLTQTVSGLLAPPGDVQNLSVVPSAGSLVLSWDQSVDLDVLTGGQVWITHTPTLSGAEFTNSINIINPVPGASTSAIVPALSGTYFAKFRDSSGVASANAASFSTTVPDLDNVNYIVTLTEHPTFAGTRTNMVYDDQVSGLVLVGAENVDDYGSVDGLSDWDYAYGAATSGSYTFSQTIDLSEVYTTRTLAKVKVFGFAANTYVDSIAMIDDFGLIDGDVPSAGNAVLRVRTTTDDPDVSPTWSSWAPFFAADYTARAFQFRLDVTTTNPESNLSVQELEVTLDVPDRVESLRDLVSGVGTYSVTYPNPFYATPTVAVTAKNLATGDYYAVTNQTRTGFDITFRNAAGSVISRTFDVLAKGYGRAQ